MSVVIVGGHDRMVRQYMDICKKYNCKGKVFTQLPGNFKGTDWSGGFDYPFHQHCFPHHGKRRSTGGRKNNITIERSHSSSSSALKRILGQYCCA